MRHRSFLGSMKQNFEINTTLLGETYTAFKLDGVSFSRFTSSKKLHKPNDQRHVNLMNQCAGDLYKQYKSEMIAAYGFSDEFSFILDKKSEIHKRKLVSTLSVLTSNFTSLYIQNWSRFMNCDLSDVSLPFFETQVFQLPNESVLVNYLKTRQLVCHYNNLHATAFWKLVIERKLSRADAHEMLKGKSESELNEILFAEFKVNYNNEPEIYRKGTLVYKNKITKHIVEASCDIDEKFCVGTLF